MNEARDLIVLVPIYQPRLDALEHFSLQHSLAQLRAGRQVAFIAPQSLDTTRYEADFPGVGCFRFDDASFASIPGYNRLLMSAGFYERYAGHEFMLVLQTDALLLRDELDGWLRQPYDYVGAPWPDGLQLLVGFDRYVGEHARRVSTHVGNGGFSLRRNRACAELLREFPQAMSYFLHTGSSEDLFFSLMGAASARFTLPGEAVASRFATELQAARYHRLNDGRPPMGGHAWWKYEPDYWLAQLGPAAEAIAAQVPRPGVSAAKSPPLPIAELV